MTISFYRIQQSTTKIRKQTHVLSHARKIDR